MPFHYQLHDLLEGERAENNFFFNFLCFCTAYVNNLKQVTKFASFMQSCIFEYVATRDQPSRFPKLLLAIIIAMGTGVYKVGINLQSDICIQVVT